MRTLYLIVALVILQTILSCKSTKGSGEANSIALYTELSRLSKNSGPVVLSGWKNAGDIGKGTFVWTEEDIMSYGPLFVKSKLHPKGGWLLRFNSKVELTNFGIFPSSKIDRTEELQVAFDVVRINSIDTLIMSKGAYLVSKIEIAPGLILLGEDRPIFKKIPNAGKWSRTLNCQRYLHEGDEDSELLKIQGIDFDGNRLNQGPYDNWQLEHQAAMFLMGSRKKSGRLKAEVLDCNFYDCVDHAVSVYSNVDLDMRNCKGLNCFRGLLTVTGGYTLIFAKNLFAGGEVHGTGIDFEVDGSGYNGSYIVNARLEDVKVKSDLDVGIRDGSVFYEKNIICQEPKYNLYCLNAKMTFENSYFPGSKQQDVSIYFPRDLKFLNCTFELDLRSNPQIAKEERMSNLSCLNVHWITGGMKNLKNQLLTFEKCDFRVLGKSKYKTVVIMSGTDVLAHNNKILVNKCTFSEGFDYAMWLNFGGNIEIKNSIIKTKQGFKLGAGPAQGVLTNLDISNVYFSSNVDLVCKKPMNGVSISSQNNYYQEDKNKNRESRIFDGGEIMYTPINKAYRINLKNNKVVNIEDLLLN